VTTTASEAFDAMLAHHRILAEEVARRVRVLRGTVESGTAYEPAAAELVAYVADEVLPHALAEEHTVYQAAAALPELKATVEEMTAEHRELASLVEQVALAGNAQGAAVRAEQIGTLFAAHVAKENELLLPPLQADDSVDLAQLLVQMHRLTEAARQTSANEGFAASDVEGVLLSLLLDAAYGLADAGQGDRACRLVAQSWATIRIPRPELAVRVTAALHRLVRSVTAQPVRLTDGAQRKTPATDEILDVRDLAPAQRHETIFATYGALGAGGGFVLVNDHDPKPLRYQFEAEHAGQFTWDPVETGPQVWRVRIGRPAAQPGGARPDQGAARGYEAELDVRALPHGQRHETIFATYDALDAGGGFVLVNDHDPKPLRYQFEAQHDGEFTWDYLEAGPKVWRVRVGRPATASR